MLKPCLAVVYHYYRGYNNAGVGVKKKFRRHDQTWATVKKIRDHDPAVARVKFFSQGHILLGAGVEKLGHAEVRIKNLSESLPRGYRGQKMGLGSDRVGLNPGPGKTLVINDFRNW